MNVEDFYCERCLHYIYGLGTAIGGIKGISALLPHPCIHKQSNKKNVIDRACAKGFMFFLLDSWCNNSNFDKNHQKMKRFLSLYVSLCVLVCGAALLFFPQARRWFELGYSKVSAFAQPVAHNEQLIVYDGEGQAVSIKTLQDGKPLVMHIWTSWCAPCQQEMPYLDQALPRLHDQGLKVVAVLVDSHIHPKQALNALGVYQIVPYGDASGKLLQQLQIRAYPTTILFDATGKEVWRAEGVVDWHAPHTIEHLAQRAGV